MLLVIFLLRIKSRKIFSEKSCFCEKYFTA